MCNKLGILKLFEKLEQQTHELGSLRKHYDSIEQSNDNAYMALQITEIEAKNELNRVTTEYQVKHQREIDELKHAILQLQEDKQVLESSVAYNKTKYIQAQVRIYYVWMMLMIMLVIMIVMITMVMLTIFTLMIMIDITVMMMMISTLIYSFITIGYHSYVRR